MYRNTDPIRLDISTAFHSRKSVEKLYEIFCEIDRDGSGEISHYEFFRFLGINVFLIGLNFLKKYLKLTILICLWRNEFSEFVLCLWNFCSCTKDALCRLSFELYDTDRSGYLDERNEKNTS